MPPLRRLPLRPVLAFLLIALLVPVPAAARSTRTVFRSQPTEWNPELGRDGATPGVSFRPLWTFEGFAAPLAGDSALEGGLVVGASQRGEIAALDVRTGAPAWRADLAVPLDFGPVALGGKIAQPAADRVIALDAADGKVAWSADLGSRVATRPRRIGARLVVATAGAEIAAIDAADGRILVRGPLPGRASTPPQPAPGVILIGTENGFVVGLDEATLAIRWAHRTGHAITGPPLYSDERVYVTAADHSLRCLRARDGRRRWIARLGAVATATPVAHGRFVYVLCYDNDVYVFRGRNGHLISRVRLGHRLDAASTVSGRMLFVVPFTAASLVSLALPGLQIAGRYDLNLPGEWFTTAPLVAEGTVALGYGRDSGRIVGLEMAQVAQTAAAPAPAAAERPGP